MGAGAANGTVQAGADMEVDDEAEGNGMTAAPLPPAVASGMTAASACGAVAGSSVRLHALLSARPATISAIPSLKGMLQF